MKMVFHFPERLDQAQDGASRLRPARMLEAFQKLGYQVEVVAGNAQQRQMAIRSIRKQVKQGVRFSFLYSESSTSPTLLTEAHHLPLHPLLDFTFLFWFKNNVGPVGLFYRDAYWMYPQYRQHLGLLKSWVGRFFHRLDLWFYRWTVDQLFLPSTQMQRILPSGLRVLRCESLPPGMMKIDVKNVEREDGGPLRLLYVGGVNPPYYDLRPLFRIASELGSRVLLTVCCREQEWSKIRLYYEDLITENVRLVHRSGAALQDLYRQADVFTLLRVSDPYLSFAVGFKIFESRAYGLPVLIFEHEEAAFELVQAGGWGVGMVSERQAVDQLRSWQSDPTELELLKAKILQSNQAETWEDRARLVADRLSKGDGAVHL